MNARVGKLHARGDYFFIRGRFSIFEQHSPQRLPRLQGNLHALETGRNRNAREPDIMDHDYRARGWIEFHEKAASFLERAVGKIIWRPPVNRRFPLWPDEKI